MSRRTITVASLQLSAHERTAFADVWPSILSRVRDAAAAGAQLVVLPEGTVPAYVLGYEPVDRNASALALEQARRVAESAGTVLVFGSIRADASCLFNSALVIDADGSLAGWADKQFLWHFDRQWFAAGDRLEPVATSLGRIGALICADGRIPTIARALVDRGAEILVMPTAWVTSGRDPNALENIQADLLARIRARENAVPFIAANKSGVELGCVAYCGKSQIVDADGSVVAMAPQDEPALLLAQVELGARPAPERTRVNVATHATQPSGSVRIAISPNGEMHDANERLRIIEATALVAPGAGNHEITGMLPAAFVDDATVLDPGGLVAYRRAGYTLAIWETRYDPHWNLSFARARAVELRVYMIVLDLASHRAFAVDPDGAILCGTFGALEMASFVFDPARTAQTLVAPGTDVLAGLAHTDAILAASGSIA